MTLKIYLKRNELSVAKFAKDLGVTPQAVFYWLSGERVPDKASMKSIYKHTGGQVTPNDFYL